MFAFDAPREKKAQKCYPFVMSVWKRVGETVLVYLLSFSWFAIFQPWGRFGDPDGFTHAKIASLISQHGFLTRFPWLDLTILDPYFVDQHLGLHILQIPFIKLFGMLPGAQIASVAFGALVATIFYCCARWLGAKKPWLWTILLLSSTIFTVRMSLAKSSPLAVSCFLIGLCAWVRTKKVTGFFAGLVFSLVHGGWLLLLFMQGLLTGAVVVWNLLRAFVGRTRSVTHLPTVSWRPELLTFLATLVGCALGVLLHPNRSNMLKFLWVQVGVIGVQTPFARVGLGEEWRSIDGGQLLSYILLFVFVIGLAFTLWYIGKERVALTAERQRTLPRRLALVGGTIVMALLTIKSRRYGEYFVPFLALTMAAFEAELNLTWAGIKRTYQNGLVRQRVVAMVLGAILLVATGKGIFDTFQAMHYSESSSFTYVDPPLNAIATVAKPGDRIFHPQWDLFPPLFASRDEFRYISGMDPTYLFAASTTRADVYTDFVFDRATTTNLYAFIRENLGANYILFQRLRNPTLEKRVEVEPRFHRLYQDANFGVYRID